MHVGFENAISFDVAPTSCEVEILPAIPLATRRPISKRIGLRLVHPDHRDRVLGIQFSSDDTKIVANTYPKNTIQIWDVRTGQQLVTIETPDEDKSGQDICIPTADFSKLYTWVSTRGIDERVKVDGQYGIKAEYPESRIQVWQTIDGKLLEEIQSSPAGMITSLSQTPDKKYLCLFGNQSGTWVGNPPCIRRFLDLANNQWKDFPDLHDWPTFSCDSQMVAFFENSETDERYVKSISVSHFPSFKKLTRITLPDGFHAGNELTFSESKRFIIAEFRTYARQNILNKWNTSVVCFDIETGKEIGNYRFPYDNDSPLCAEHIIDNATLLMVTWRENPKKLIALNVPEMTVKWEAEIGDFNTVKSPIISPNNKFLAVICTPGSKYDEPRGDQDVDWDLVPQPQMKLFDCQTGELLETMDLPIGSNGLVFSNDGKTAAFGAVGSVYYVDFSDLMAK